MSVQYRLIRYDNREQKLPRYNIMKLANLTFHGSGIYIRQNILKQNGLDRAGRP